MKLYQAVLCCISLGVLSAGPVYAQGGKNIKAVAKGMAASSGQMTVSSAVRPLRQLTAMAPVSGHTAAASGHIQMAMNRFVNQHKKELFKLQTAVGISPRRAANNLTHIGAAPTKKQLITTQDEAAFVTKDFHALSYQHGPLPAVPFTPHPHYMYRGLGLETDGADVRNILQNGLRTQDVGPDHNTLRLSYASLGGRGALQSVSSRPVINLTNSPTVALHYAKRYREKGMMVLVVVREKTNRGAVITTEKDIPAQDILAVAALLSIRGKPVWCQIELTDEGFLVTPYGTNQP